MTNQNSFNQSSSYKVYLEFLGDYNIYAQNVQLPDVSINPTPVGTNSGSYAYIAGDHLDYSPLTIGFLVGEDFTIYYKILRYIFDRIHPNNGELEPLKEFTTIIDITDSKGIDIVRFEFRGCKLNNIGSLQLVSNAEDADASFDLTIHFEWFDIELVNVNDKLSNKIIKS